MIARVVPITRLRRDTTFWSYRIPPRSICTAGSLVVVPFRGRPTLGVIWEILETDEKATESLSQILTPGPLVRLPHRRFIEYLSEVGLCSLSTALYQWMPAGLRQLPLTARARQLIADFAAWKPSSQELAQIKQHVVTVTGQRPLQTALLKQKFGDDCQELFASSDNELETWFTIAMGRCKIGIGRERAIFAPWFNLRHLTIIEPEDVFYYHEQTPYLDLARAAQFLGDLFKAQLTLRSYLPTPASRLLWGESSLGNDATPPSVELVHLGQEPFLGSSLVAALQRTLAQQKKRAYPLQLPRSYLPHSARRARNQSTDSRH